MTYVESITAQAEYTAAHPEGVTVRVLTPHRALADAAAPMMCERLYPGRRYGRILHIEPAPGGFDVTVHDRGPMRPR